MSLKQQLKELMADYPEVSLCILFGSLANRRQTAASDIDLQDILSVNLERAVQLCVNIGTHIIAISEEEAPSSMAETFNILAKQQILTEETANVMRKVVGFRNIAVHNYKKIDWEIVFNICTRQLADFKRFAREINTYIMDSY